MAGGGGSPIARVMGQIEQQANVAIQSPGYTAPQQTSPYQTAYSPFGGVYQPAFTPMQQQQVADPYSQTGLGLLYAQMMSQYNNPQMGPPTQYGIVSPQYSDPALQYRPNLTQAQESLNRIYIPPAYDAVDPETGQPTYDYGGDDGGGDGGGDGDNNCVDCVDHVLGGDESSFQCLKLNDAIKDFSRYPVHNLFIGKLDYLIMKNYSLESEFVNLTSKKDETKEILEIDKEMIKIIGIELETRKLDCRLQPQNSAVNLPFSGLIQKKTGIALSGSPSILLKKKKKLVLKTLSNK